MQKVSNALLAVIHLPNYSEQMPDFNHLVISQSMLHTRWRPQHL